MLFRSHRTYVFFLLIPLAALSFTRLRAQAVEDSIAAVRSRLEEKIADRQQLERMLAAVNDVDSVYKVRYPTWIILDEDLKERIFKIVRMRYPGASRGGDVMVIANPEAGDIIELRAGTQRLGRIDTRLNLSDSLHAYILSGNYPRRLLELTPAHPRYNVLTARPNYAAITASAFGATFLLSNGFGLEAKMGEEELGYHFWATGDFRVRVIVDQLKFGVILPFAYGMPTSEPPGPLSVRPRALTGIIGVSGEYEHPVGEDQVGIRTSVGEVKILSIQDYALNPFDFYSLHSIVQAYYVHQAQFGRDEHLFTFTGGVGYHQILHTIRDSTRPSVTSESRSDFVSPLLRVDYVRQGGTLYGASIQYCNSILFMSVWAEFIKNFLFLDLKYYTPIFRQEKPWEQRYFFMVSPRIQIVY